jgi:protoheme ferro-lyase
VGGSGLPVFSCKQAECIYGFGEREHARVANDERSDFLRGYYVEPLRLAAPSDSIASMIRSASFRPSIVACSFHSIAPR